MSTIFLFNDEVANKATDCTDQFCVMGISFGCRFFHSLLLQLASRFPKYSHQQPGVFNRCEFVDPTCYRDARSVFNFQFYFNNQRSVYLSLKRGIANIVA